MEAFTINVSGGTRRVTENGRKYLVAPATILVADQVLNGSKGKLFYSKRRVATNVGEWNGQPIVRNHPADKDGRPISAHDLSNGKLNQAIIEKFGLGEVRNDSWDGTARRVKLWFDEEHTRNKCPETHGRLERSEPFELSTGLFTQDRAVQNGLSPSGDEYTHEVDDYTPDHLAILPTQVGACSRKMGCGVNNEETCECEKCKKKRKDDDTSTTNSDEKRTLLQKLGEWLGLTDNSMGKGNYSLSRRSEYAEELSTAAERASLDAKDEAGHAAARDAHEAAAAAHRSAGGEAAGARSKGASPDLYANSGHGAKAAEHDAKAKEHAEQCAGYETPIINTETQTPTEGDDMGLDRTKVITDLTTNCECWRGKAKTLNGLDNDALTILARQSNELAEGKTKTLAANALLDIAKQNGAPADLTLNAMPAFIQAKIDAKKKGKKKDDDEDDEEEVPTKNQFDDFLKLPIEQRMAKDEIETIKFAREIEHGVKKQLVDKVVTVNASSEAHRKVIRPVYEALDIKTLRTLVAELPQTRQPVETRNARQDEVDTILDYSGAGGGYAPNRNGQYDSPDPDDVLEPTFNAAKYEAELRKKEEAAAK